MFGGISHKLPFMKVFPIRTPSTIYKVSELIKLRLNFDPAGINNAMTICRGFECYSEEARVVKLSSYDRLRSHGRL